MDSEEKSKQYEEVEIYLENCDIYELDKLEQKIKYIKNHKFGVL